MLKTEDINGGKRGSIHTSGKWYRYEAKRIETNIEKIDTIFIGKLYIGAEDLIEHIAYCKHGCYMLLESMRGMKRRLRDLEDQMRAGKWITNISTAISKLTSDKIDLYINNIANISKLLEFANMIHEDLYMAYFIDTMPNIILSEPKQPHFPALPKDTISVKDKTKLIKLIEDTIPYLNVLEIFHNSMSKLVNEANKGLERMLSR